MTLATPPNPSGLCMCGCGAVTSIAKRSRGTSVVRGEHVRYLRGHDKRRASADYLLVEGPLSTPCWEWQHSCYPAGYGYVDRGGYRGGAHRWMWLRNRGPLTSDQHLDHLCRNRRCVNPEHLEPVTLAENSRRGLNAKVGHVAADEIRRLYADGALQDEIAARFGVSQQTVSKVVAGETWGGERVA